MLSSLNLNFGHENIHQYLRNILITHWIEGFLRLLPLMGFKDPLDYLPFAFEGVQFL